MGHDVKMPNVADGVPYIVMQYIEGEELSEYARRNREGWRVVVEVLAKTAKILSIAHNAGLVHRDIKPTNILVRTNGDPVLVDFGLARDLESHTLHLTGTHALLGSPAYLAPEMIAQNAPASRSTDLYAFGVTMYECLAGDLPYRGSTQAAMLHSVLHEPVPKLPVLPPDRPAAIGSMLRFAMAKDGAHR